jgi:hypothetical protein
VGAATARERPDVALVGLGVSSEHALDLIDKIVHEATCPVIALLHAADPEFVTEAAKRGVFAYIDDDEPAAWRNAIEIVLLRFAEYHNLEEAFGRRAITERAKGILMERHSIEEDQAFELLRTQSTQREPKAGRHLAGRSRRPRVATEAGLGQSLPGTPGLRVTVPSTLPIVASVRQTFVSGEVAVSATGDGVPAARLGNATPHETISLELSSTGLSFMSSDASAFRTDGAVGIFMSCLSVARGKARGLRASPARR